MGKNKDPRGCMLCLAWLPSCSTPKLCVEPALSRVGVAKLMCLILAPKTHPAVAAQFHQPSSGPTQPFQPTHTPFSPWHWQVGPHCHLLLLPPAARIEMPICAIPFTFIGRARSKSSPSCASCNLGIPPAPLHPRRPVLDRAGPPRQRQKNRAA
jgi:hypothetical protein